MTCTDTQWWSWCGFVRLLHSLAQKITWSSDTSALCSIVHCNIVTLFTTTWFAINSRTIKICNKNILLLEFDANRSAPAAFLGGFANCPAAAAAAALCLLLHSPAASLMLCPQDWGRHPSRASTHHCTVTSRKGSVDKDEAASWQDKTICSKDARNPLLALAMQCCKQSNAV